MADNDENGPPRMTVGWRLTAVLPMAFVGLAEDIITIATLGFYSPGWSLNFIMWRTQAKHRRWKQRQARSGSKEANE